MTTTATTAEKARNYANRLRDEASDFDNGTEDLLNEVAAFLDSAALTASPAQDDQSPAFERAAEIALTFRPRGENAKHFVDVLVCDIATAIRQEARNA